MQQHGNDFDSAVHQSSLACPAKSKRMPKKQNDYANNKDKAVVYLALLTFV